MPGSMLIDDEAGLGAVAKYVELSLLGKSLITITKITLYLLIYII